MSAYDSSSCHEPSPVSAALPDDWWTVFGPPPTIKTEENTEIAAMWLMTAWKWVELWDHQANRKNAKGVTVLTVEKKKRRNTTEPLRINTLPIWTQHCSRSRTTSVSSTWLTLVSTGSNQHGTTQGLNDKWSVLLKADRERNWRISWRSLTDSMLSWCFC